MIVRAEELRVGDHVVARVSNQVRGMVVDVKIEDGRVLINYDNGDGMTAGVKDELTILDQPRGEA